MCGTLDYLAPEIVENKAMIMQLIAGLWVSFVMNSSTVTIHLKQRQRDTFRRIMKVDLSFPTTPSVSVEAKNLIRRLLVTDSSKTALFRRLWSILGQRRMQILQAPTLSSIFNFDVIPQWC